MRILIYGECDLYGSGAWCYFHTLKDMGHEVSFFSPATELEHYSKIFYRAIKKIKGGGVLNIDRLKHVRALLDKAQRFQPEVIIVLKGLLLDRDVIRKLKHDGAWVTLINHDDFFSEFKSSRSRLQFEAVSEYNYIFPTKEINVEELKHYTNEIEFFPFAYYPVIHKPPADPNPEDNLKWRAEVAFIGNCYPKRIKQLEFLVKHSNRPLDLKIYGYNWHKVTLGSPLSKYIQNRALNPEEMAKALFYSKISLGFLCKENRDDYTQRSFEIPACLGVLLAERTERHQRFYKEGIEAEFFDSENFNELKEKVNSLLENDEHCQKIRSNGYHSVISGNHTYHDRLIRFFEIYNNRNLKQTYEK